MGRPQGFDTTAAVRAAREVFWTDGYESASLPQLEAATGLNRSSIYHAFGSKHGLFLRAIDNYLHEVIEPTLKPLRSGEPGAVSHYLLGLRSALASQGAASTRGCLLLSSAGAPIGRTPDVRQVIATYHRTLTKALRQALTQRPDADIAATTIAALVVTALTLAPVNPEAALAQLDAATHWAAPTTK